MGLATDALVGLAWGLVRAAGVGWSAADVPAALAGGVLFAIGFVAWERRAGRPLLDVRLFRSRSFRAINGATACHSAVVLGAVFLMAQFLQAEVGVGSFGAGLRLLPWTGSMLIVAPVAGRRGDRIGTRPVIVGGLAAAAAGSVWLSWLSRPGVAYPALVGGARARRHRQLHRVRSPVRGHLRRRAPGRPRPRAGANNAIRQTGGVLGIAVVALAFTAACSFADRIGAAHGFRAATALCAAICLTGALAGMLTPARPRFCRLAANPRRGRG